MVGVCPRGAQVRFKGETGEKPVSSTKTSVAFSLRHFFYPWPSVALPLRNRFIIACQAAPLGFLATPADALHQVPHTTCTIADPEQVPDQPRNPVERPVVFGIAVGIGTAFERCNQPPELCRGQTTGSSRRATTEFLFQFWLLRLALPTADALRSGSDVLSDPRRTLALAEQRQGTLATLGQLFRGSNRSHVLIMAHI